MRKTLAVIAGALALPLVTLSAANADNGDGLEACNNYEICFARNSSNLDYQRHFYYGDTDHGGNHWYNVVTNTSTQSSIEDDINRVKNRDGSKCVKVIDWNGALPSVSHTIKNNNTWTELKDGVRDQNNEHQRISC